MVTSDNGLIVLDTNIVVHTLRGSSTGYEIERRFQLTSRYETPVVSSVTLGEIFGLARAWNWGETRMKRLNELMNEFVQIDAGRVEVVNAYSDVYVLSRGLGYTMGQNDMWIAATCLASGAQLVTTDGDFDWLHPEVIIRHFVRQQ